MNLESIKTLINTNMKDAKKCIEERRVYYTITYLAVYIFQLIMEGIHGWQSLFPIKMAAIASAIVMGNLLYDSSKKMRYIQIQEKAVKYTSIMLVMFFIFFLVQRLILAIFGFNIMPLI